MLHKSKTQKQREWTARNLSPCSTKFYLLMEIWFDPLLSFYAPLKRYCSMANSLFLIVLYRLANYYYKNIYITLTHAELTDIYSDKKSFLFCLGHLKRPPRSPVETWIQFLQSVIWAQQLYCEKDLEHSKSAAPGRWKGPEQRSTHFPPS